MCIYHLLHSYSSENSIRMYNFVCSGNNHGMHIILLNQMILYDLTLTNSHLVCLPNFRAVCPDRLSLALYFKSPIHSVPFEALYGCFSLCQDMFGTKTISPVWVFGLVTNRKGCVY